VVDDEPKEVEDTEVCVELLELISESDVALVMVLVLVLVLVMVANVVDETLDVESLELDVVVDVATVALRSELEVEISVVELTEVELRDVDEATEVDEDTPATSLAPLTALYTGAPTLDFI
jgi:hypothetical protein